MDEFEELRRLLLGLEQEQLRALRARLEDPENRARDVSSVLPQAVRLSRESRGELSSALRPAVQGSIQETIRAQPEIFVDMLHPIIGPLVRRSIAESLRGLLESLNKTLEHTFSWQGLKWRVEAWRTGKTFAEVVLLRSLVYRVEQLFLIHRATSLSLLHVADPAAGAKDSDMVAGLWSAIQDFARDAFQAGDSAGLEEFRVGELQGWIVPGRYALLAAVIRGNPSRELHDLLEETIDAVHVQQGAALAHFDGDASVFEPLRPELERCLQVQYKGAPGSGPPTRALLLLLVLANIALILGIFACYSEWRWHGFLNRLEAEPGIAVTTAQKGWLSKSHVEGLKDPSAKDPVEVAREARIDPATVQFAWKSFLALDAESVWRRFKERFSVPEGAEPVINGGVLTIAGKVPYEWLERVRREATQVPGIVKLAEGDMRVTFDPKLTLQRFDQAFPPPPSVTARVENGTLILAGNALYEWIAPVRAGATHIPGITAIVEKDLNVLFDAAGVLQRFTERFGMPDGIAARLVNGTLVLSGDAPHGWYERLRQAPAEIPGVTAVDMHSLVDRDLREYQQSKSIVESAFVYFLPGKDNFATEGFAALSRLPEQLRRCQSAGLRIGLDITVEVRGYADSVGATAANADLSRRRATAVRDFLVSCGIDDKILKPLGLGEASKAGPDAKPLPEQSDRRVGFRVISQPVSARQ